MNNAPDASRRDRALDHKNEEIRIPAAMRIICGLVGAMIGGVLFFGIAWLLMVTLKESNPVAPQHGVHPVIYVGLSLIDLCGFNCGVPIGVALGAVVGAIYFAPMIDRIKGS